MPNTLESIHNYLETFDKHFPYIVYTTLILNYFILNPISRFLWFYYEMNLYNFNYHFNEANIIRWYNAGVIMYQINAIWCYIVILIGLIKGIRKVYGIDT